MLGTLQKAPTGPWEAGLEDALAAVIAQGGRPPDRDDRLGPDSLNALNEAAASAGLRAGPDRPLRFIDAGSLGRLSAVGYETHIGRHGEVPTRCEGHGVWHDWYNALVWLAWSSTKRALNEAQCRLIRVQTRECPTGNGRSAGRDSITLFDESGLVMVCDQPRLRAALRAHGWQTLFVTDREAFDRHVRIWSVGHGLLDKLRQPFKAVCGRAWILPVEPALPRRHVDARLAAMIAAGLPMGDALHPLPVLGIPGWWADNEQAGFYDDPAVFRAARGLRPRHHA
ncbi:MAG: DUF3025 domain-containing protein [Burkholderiaceae bacterium]